MARRFPKLSRRDLAFFLIAQRKRRLLRKNTHRLYAVSSMSVTATKV